MTNPSKALPAQPLEILQPPSPAANDSFDYESLPASLIDTARDPFQLEQEFTNQLLLDKSETASIKSVRPGAAPPPILTTLAAPVSSALASIAWMTGAAGAPGETGPSKPTLKRVITSPQGWTYTVASQLRDHEFHELFPTIAEDDHLVEGITKLIAIVFLI